MIDPSCFRNAKSADLAARLGLVMWPLLFYWQYTLGQIVFFFGDTEQFWLPTRTAYAAALHAWQMPLWVPGMLAGFPLFAEMQTGALYPPHLVLYSLLPTDLALNWDILGHLAWMGLGMYAFGRQQRLSAPGALLAGVVYAAGGFAEARTAQVNVLTTAAWAPWTLYLLEEYVSKPGRGRFITLALACACVILIGHPQFATLTFILFGLYLAARIFGLLPAPGGRPSGAGLVLALLGGAAALVLGAGLAAAQLLPTLELAQLSTRLQDSQAAFNLSYSLHPLLSALYVHPFHLGNPYPAISTEGVGYLGLFPLLLVGFLPFLRRDRQVVFWLAVALVAFSLALGTYNPLYRAAANRWLPAFFRAPARWLYLTTFAGALLAGISLDALIARTKASTGWQGSRAGMAAFAVAAALVCGTAPLAPLEFWLWLEQALPFVLGLAALLVALGCWRKKLSRSWVAVLVIGVTVVDLALFGAVYEHLYNAGLPLAVVRSKPRLLAALNPTSIPKEDARFYTSCWILPWSEPMRQALYPNLALMYSAQQVPAYTPLYPFFAREYMATLTGQDRGPQEPGAIASDPCTFHQTDSGPATGMFNALAARYYLVPQVPATTAETEGQDLFDPFVLNPIQRTMVIPPTQADKLVVESSLSQSVKLRDGDAVATIEIGIEGGKTISRTLHAGVDTGEWAFDRTDVRVQVQHTRPPLASTFPAGSAMPVEYHEGHTYQAELDLGPVRVVSIRIDPLVVPGLFHLASLVLDRPGEEVSAAQLVHAGDHRIVYRDLDVTAFENRDRLPRARLVYSMTIAGDRTALEVMRRPEWDPTEQNFIAEGEPLGPPSQPAVGGSVQIEVDEATRVVLQADAKSEGFVILADAWYPGWTALVDGEPQPVRRADVLFRAVKVPPGRHRIEFNYQPKSLEVGVEISAAAALVLAALYFFPRRRLRVGI